MSHSTDLPVRWWNLKSYVENSTLQQNSIFTILNGKMLSLSHQLTSNF